MNPDLKKYLRTNERLATRDITECCVRGEVEKGGVLWEK